MVQKRKSTTVPRVTPEGRQSRSGKLIAGTLEFNPALTYLTQILDVARGLEYLHTLPSPVVHGDIKGANVLVDDDGCAKIGDFGLAKSTEEIITGLTTMDVPLGSIPWLAPELINESSPYHTTASDVWAFGYLALEVSYRQHPPTRLLLCLIVDYTRF